MEVQQEPQQKKSILDDLVTVTKEIRAQANGQKTEASELPEGLAEEQSAPAAEEIVAAAPEEKAPIRIGDKEFKTTEEAIKYAEQLDQEKLLAESYNMGIKEALSLTQQQQQVAPPPEENFEEQFYANPKEALLKIKEQAKQEIKAEFDAQKAEAAAWAKFSSTYPDLADSEKEVRQIMTENWDVLGKMRDQEKAMQLLATKTRAYFNSIVERMKPRTELSNKSGQVVSAGGQSQVRVTPKQKNDEPLTLAQQLKSMRGRK